MAELTDLPKQLRDLIQAELDSGRVTMTDLAAAAGVSRSNIYGVLQAKDSTGSLRVLGRLATALAITLDFTLKRGDGPAHELTRRNQEAAASGRKGPRPPPVDAPPVHRWLSNAEVTEAWKQYPGDIASTALTLRMHPAACRLRLQVMGLIPAGNPHEAELLRTYQAIANARWAGIPVPTIALQVQRTPRAVQFALHTMAISGKSGRPRREQAVSSGSDGSDA